MTCIKDGSNGNGEAIRAAFAVPHTVNASTTITSAAPDTNTTQELTAFSLTLTGANMDNTDTVRFHNNATNTNYDLTGPAANIKNRGSGKFVDVDVPATIPAGTYTISVAQGTTFGGSYTYILKAKPVLTPPTITAVSPNPGTEQSTAQFTLNGTGLKGTGTTTVSFGGGGNATNVTPNAAGTLAHRQLPGDAGWDLPGHGAEQQRYVVDRLLLHGQRAAQADRHRSHAGARSGQRRHHRDHHRHQPADQPHHGLSDLQRHACDGHQRDRRDPDRQDARGYGRPGNGLRLQRLHAERPGDLHLHQGRSLLPGRLLQPRLHRRAPLRHERLRARPGGEHQGRDRPRPARLPDLPAACERRCTPHPPRRASSAARCPPARC